ncbi:zinc transporter ZIP1-like [Elysia marginata]|uniref:Zinc transporter ZIP1-like n=1 Tax=Elysia marginata TaxID=1093978 RepID=A0AAV4JM71_9GAST|nr:zinc transporter ZIP1-like [Elysia marginata]
MALTIAKVVMAIVLFILTVMFSFSPYLHFYIGLVSNISPALRNRVLTSLNCFAGGVFLGTLLIHILAEGAEDFDEYKERIDLDTDYPIFNLIVGVGFLLVAFVEYAAQAFLFHLHTDNVPENTTAMHSVSSENRSYGATDRATRANSYSCGNSHDTKEKMEAALLNHNGCHSSTAMMAEQQIPERSDDLEVENTASLPVSGTRAYLLLIALSFHTVFDGLAVGLQDDETEVWSVFAAVTIHKSIIAFCLGMEVFQSGLERPIQGFIWLGVFAFMSPLGIVIGIGLTSGGVDETAKLLTSSVLQALAGGTFMYVTLWRFSPLISNIQEEEMATGACHWS